MAGSQFNVLCAVVVVYLAVPTSTGYKVCPPLSRPHPRGICGNEVYKSLRLVCGKDGYAKNGKRSDMPPLSADQEIDDPVDQPEAIGSHVLSDYYINKREASFFLNKRAKVKIICECCYNKCSLRELTGYCLNPLKAYSRFSQYGIGLDQLHR